MKIIELARATESLESYARGLGQEPLVLTDGGHAIAALLPVDDADVELMMLSLSPKFQAIIDRARCQWTNAN